MRSDLRTNHYLNHEPLAPVIRYAGGELLIQAEAGLYRFWPEDDCEKQNLADQLRKAARGIEVEIPLVSIGQGATKTEITEADIIAKQKCWMGEEEEP